MNFGKIKGGTPRLYNVMVSYPENQDMDEVLKQLKQEYGLESESYPNYMGNLGEEKIVRETITATDHKKYFLSKETLKSQLTEEQEKEFHTILEKRFPNSNDWEEFLTGSPVSMLTWTDNFSYSEPISEKMKTSKNKLFFNAAGFYGMDKNI